MTLKEIMSEVELDLEQFTNIIFHLRIHNFIWQEVKTSCHFILNIFNNLILLLKSEYLF